MKKIVLISCVSKKLNHKAKAKDLYVSPLFKKNFLYANSLKPDNIYILSALYGLVPLLEEIEPYDKTLNKMILNEKQEWAGKVIKQMQNLFDLQNDEFIFLAGENYRKFLIPHIKNYVIPMKGLGIGKQLKWLTEKIKNE